MITFDADQLRMLRSIRGVRKVDIEKELKKFQGTWTFESVEAGGKEVPIADFKGITVTFDGDKYSVKMGDKVIHSAVGTRFIFEA